MPKRGRTDSDDEVEDHDEVESPTYFGTIQHLFNEVELSSHSQNGLDLHDYATVKAQAIALLKRVSEGPLAVRSQAWPSAKVQTLKTWILHGCKPGSHPPIQTVARARTATASSGSALRIRKNIANLSQAELTTLGNAFQLLFNNNGALYRPLVQIHADYCLHHNVAFFHWHRLYINHFENALREVSNDTNLTLPYWDFTVQPFPPAVLNPPFDQFAGTTPLYNGAGNTTRRAPINTIYASYNRTNVAGDVSYSLTQSVFEGFTGYVRTNPTSRPGAVRAHDNAHNSFGIGYATMSNPQWSPYDPIFWFYHCNWERLYWAWQKNYNAITLSDYTAHVQDNNPDWINQPLLQPFTVTNGNVAVTSGRTFATPASTLNLNTFGVDFDVLPPSPAQPRTVHTASTVNRAAKVSTKSIVTVQNVNRVNIPGNFEVVLLVDGEEHQATTFFQAASPTDCENCRQVPLMNFEFHVKTADIVGRTVEVRVEVDGEPLDPIDFGVPEIVISHGLH